MENVDVSTYCHRNGTDRSNLVENSSGSNSNLGAVKKKILLRTKSNPDGDVSENLSTEGTAPKASKKKSSKKKVVDRFVDAAPSTEKQTPRQKLPRPASSETNNVFSELSSKIYSSDNMRGSKQSRRASVPNNEFKKFPQRSPSSLSSSNTSKSSDKKKSQSRSKTPDPKVTPNKHQAQRTPNSGVKRNQLKFEPYIPLFQVQQGLKRGEFIEGALRINPRNYEDAYVNSPDGKMDIYIGGMQNRNRALQGDMVVVQVNPKQEWKVLCDAIKDYQEKSGVAIVPKPVRSPPCKVHTPDKFSSPRSRPMSSSSWRSNALGERLPDTLEILGIDKLTKQIHDMSLQEKQAKNQSKRKLKFGKSKDSSTSFSQESSEDYLDKGGPSIAQNFAHDNVLPEVQKEYSSSNSIILENSHTVKSNEVSACDLNEVETFNLEVQQVNNVADPWEHEVPALNLLISPEQLLSIDGNSILEGDGYDHNEESGGEENVIIVPPGDLSGDEFTDSASVSSTHSGQMEKRMEDIAFLASQQDAQNNNVEVDNQYGHIIQNQSNVTNSPMYISVPNTTAVTREKSLECRMQENQAFHAMSCNEIGKESVVCTAVSDISFSKSHSSSDENVNVLNSAEVCSMNCVETAELGSNDINYKKQKNRRRKKKPRKPNNEPCQKANTELVNENISSWTVEEVMKHAQYADFIQRTGKVVYILERKHSLISAGSLKLCPDKNPKYALFSPNDSRVPRIMIPISDCPKNFYHRAQDYVNFLFLARIIEWNDSSTFASGHLIKNLGNTGDVEVQTEGILVENSVEHGDFPEEVMNCLPQGEWEIPEAELSSRRDLRKECIFTIDPATARDMDDAMSCRALKNGNFEVGVHIADVGYFVGENTRLDEFAKSRSTSVYLVQKVIPMLPRKLCDDLCSLNPAKDRLTFSVIWEMTPEGKIVDQWFGRTVINSCAKLSYEHAQSIIENPGKIDWGESEFPPITGGFLVNDIAKRITQLHHLASKLREERFLNGALKLDQVKLQFTLNPETGLPSGISSYVQKDSNRLIEDFMLLANMSVARKIYETFPTLALLRRHPPPQSRPLQQVVSMCEALGIILDVTSSGTLHKSIEQYSGDDYESKARTELLVNLLSKPMNRALYFCSGVLEDPSVFCHYALNVPLYTHFTSPIRRYPDILVHRLLGACLGYNAPPSMTSREMEVCAAHCSDKKYNSKLVSDQSSELFTAAFIRELGSAHARGMVMGVLERAFDCLILNMGIVKRVYCDKLPLLQRSFKRSHGVSRLNIVWEDDDVQSGVEQALVVFAFVDLKLTVDQDSLQIRAILQKPQA